MCLFFCQWEGDGSLIAIFLKKFNPKKKISWKKLFLYANTPIPSTCQEESSMKSNVLIKF